MKQTTTGKQNNGLCPFAVQPQGCARRIASRSVSSFLSDIRFALRALRRRPVFAAVAILTIGPGIGAATALYSVVDGVLLRSLPFPDSERLVSVWRTYPQWRKDPIPRRNWDRAPISLPEY